MNLSKMTILAVAFAFVGTVVAEAAPARRKAAPKRTETYRYEQPSRPASSGTVGMAGCGLGSMVIEDQGKWAQVGSAFLNGTGMQTFGISFGTSNCTEDGVASLGRERDVFVEANLPDIRRDVAAGEGEYLSSLQSLYGCEDGASFSQALQRNQEKVTDSASIHEIVKSERLSCEG